MPGIGVGPHPNAAAAVAMPDVAREWVLTALQLAVPVDQPGRFILVGIRGICLCTLSTDFLLPIQAPGSSSRQARCAKPGD
jgi:hypothetical protein